MEYPKSTNIKKWEYYLERKLDVTEKRLLCNASQEIQLNKCIYKLIGNIKNKNLYIPTLSVSDGNCLYDSICYKLNSTPYDIRKNISNFMKLYKKYPDIFPSNDMTLEDMFTFQNEIDYIYDKNTNKFCENGILNGKEWKNYHKLNCPLSETMKKLFKDFKEENLKLIFGTGAIYGVNKELILNNDKIFYTSCIDILNNSSNLVNPDEGHSFERLWFYIFNQ